MKSFKIVFFVFIFCYVEILYAQSPEKIKFSKNQGIIYFFQKGAKSDSIINSKSDLFYLYTPDRLKPYFSLSVENGRMIRTINDSILKFEYLPGLKYESVYVKKDVGTIQRQGSKDDKSTGVSFDLKTLINGVTDKKSNVIFITISDKLEEKVLIENSFYYR